MDQEPRYLVAGDAGLVVEFADRIDPIVNEQVHALSHAMDRQPIAGVIETVPTYRSLLAVYDPLVVGWAELVDQVSNRLRNISETAEQRPSRSISVPTVYGGEHGPDVDFVAEHNGLSVDDVIAIHSAVNYQVYMIGFTPGFPYLGGMSERIAAPRLERPRTRIPAGSVGIAGSQTGIYPVDSPGGWRLIGRTPLSLYDPGAEDPVLLRPGDRVRFEPIDQLQSTGQPVSRSAGQQVSRSAGLVKVVKPGLLTTIQDGGRPGYMRLGIPPSGAMDRFSLQAANSLVGNEPGEACLEITLLGPTLEFSSCSLIAIAGADFGPTLNGRPMETWSSFEVQPGDRLSLPAAQQGCRAYVAFRGGIRVAAALGSRSTYLRGRLGGNQGRALQARDAIPIGQTGESFAGRRLPSRFRPRYPLTLTARVVLGPQSDHFPPESVILLQGAEYRVLSESDRMGYRLSGARLFHSRGSNIISDGVVAGAIQVPGDGNPIVMLADRQTTGGYPKIATVIAPDLDRIGQLKPGDRIRFAAISLETAHDAYRSYRRNLDSVRSWAGGQPTGPKGGGF